MSKNNILKNKFGNSQIYFNIKKKNDFGKVFDENWMIV